MIDRLLTLLFTLPTGLQMVIVMGVFLLTSFAVCQLLGGLVISARVEGSNLVVRLFHLIPIRDIYLREVASSALGDWTDLMRTRWSSEQYGLSPLSLVVLTLRTKGSRRVIVRCPNARSLLAEIQAFH